MGRVKTFTYAGSILPGDLNSIEDDYEFAFSRYRDIFVGWSSVTGVPGGTSTVFGAGVYAIGANWARPTGPPGGSSLFASIPVLYLDPADYQAGTRELRYRLRADVACNDNQPQISLSVGLYPILDTFGNVDNSIPQVALIGLTVGTVVTDSLISFSPLGTRQVTSKASADFTPPPAGYYVLGLSAARAQSTHAALSVTATLQHRSI